LHRWTDDVPRNIKRYTFVKSDRLIAGRAKKNLSCTGHLDCFEVVAIGIAIERPRLKAEVRVKMWRYAKQPFSFDARWLVGDAEVNSTVFGFYKVCSTSLDCQGRAAEQDDIITTCLLMSQWESSAYAHAIIVASTSQLRYTLEDIVLLLGVLTVM
jgi:hypothetical protein